MFTSIRIKKGYWVESLKVFSAMFLLLSFLIGSNNLETFHHLFHQHADNALHSAEQELDPCHRVIYHFEKSTTCDHQTHLSTTESCKILHVYFHTDQVVISDVPYEPYQANFIFKESWVNGEIAHPTVYLPSRAPPFS